MWNKCFLFLLIGLCLAAFSCQKSKGKSIEIVHFDWDSSIITAEIVKILLEKDLGCQVNLTSTFPAAGWAAAGAGMADVCVSAWLPDTHKAYYESLGDQVEILSICTTGLQIGLAVPCYVSCNTVEELKDHVSKFGGKIHGIDPGAGIMVVLESAVKEYGLGQYEVIEGSESLMLSSIDEAIKRSEWIVFTAWSPHHVFQRHKIKYLEDPKQVFGHDEFAALFARKDFQRDWPEAYKLLKQLRLEKSDLEQMEHEIRVNQMKPQDIARKWVENNKNKQ